MLMTGDILCRGSYPSSPGSGTSKLSLQCRNCRMAWKRFRDIILPKFSVSKDHARGLDSEYDSNFGFFAIPMLNTILINTSISSVSSHRNPIAKTRMWAQYSWRSAFPGDFLVRITISLSYYNIYYIFIIIGMQEFKKIVQNCHTRAKVDGPSILAPAAGMSEGQLR